MKKNLLILRFFTALSLLPISTIGAFADPLVIEMPNEIKPTSQAIAYLCDTGKTKEKVTATYLNADAISLVDFTWKNERVIGANVLAASGAKYAGAQYIWWMDKDDVTLYDLINDPKEENPIHCSKDTTLLF
ncbi:MliC family protein [Bartonella sp. A05]|uniref:MliC family protein n=1 Tax=Bartonella sp. A05 TaxID=2967261 RepID=UPI0022A95941|nr:MliC family protein [Bartonella sp. A05]MCZ2203544.1 MliC family protein [Bartonella sp. A05]